MKESMEGVISHKLSHYINIFFYEKFEFKKHIFGSTRNILIPSFNFFSIVFWNATYLC